MFAQTANDPELPALVNVPATEFVRGVEPAKTVFRSGRKAHVGPDWDEGPAHRVKLASFAISRDQVSMAEFLRFMPDYRQRLDQSLVEWNPEAAAVMVSWHEATDYCQWMSRRAGQKFRLPTESEWELAARESPANGLDGLGDGTQEWCLDWWKEYESSGDGIRLNPCGPKNGIVKVVRDGGGGSIEEQSLAPNNGVAVTDYRTTDRSATLPDDRRANLGFRLAVGDHIQQTRVNPADVVQPRGVPFEQVIQNPADWGLDLEADKPRFQASTRFIADSPEVVPYWGRHHVPSVTWCDNGDLLATCITAAFDNSDQMAILLTRLRRGSTIWDKPAVFFLASDHNVTSSALFHAKDGDIHHYNGLGNNLCEDFSMFKRVSKDNGVTWSRPKIVHRFPANAASPENPHASPRLWPHMDIKVWNADDGECLVMSTDVGAGNERGSALFASFDNGDSWQEITRTGFAAESFAGDGKSAGWIAGIHAPVVMLDGGNLMGIGRSNDIDGFSPMSRSSDQGRTWRYSASPFPAISSSQRSVLMRLAEGPLLHVSFTDTTRAQREGRDKGMLFDTSTGTPKRGVGMFAAVSVDQGKTWPLSKLISNHPSLPWKSRSGGYLSCVQTPDNMLHLITSSHYYSFHLEWIKVKPTHTDRH